jgi:hypothetical protein
VPFAAAISGYFFFIFVLAISEHWAKFRWGLKSFKFVFLGLLLLELDN